MTTLVTDRKKPHVFTANAETDARTALTRGLAEFVESSIVVDAPKGRHIEFTRVFDTWAEAEEMAKYPSGIVYAPNLPGTYDAVSFTPVVNHKAKTADGQYVIASSELVCTMLLEVWANDNEERLQLGKACEDLLNSPTLDQTGFVLELPHYYNQRASYLLQASTYNDTEEDAMRRYRKMTFTLMGSVPVTKLAKLPIAKPRAIVKEVGPEVVVEVT